MPQIQYPAYTQPPSPPVPPPQLGWRTTLPDNVQLTPRGRYGPGKLITALQTVGATVFAQPQWALPVPLLAKAYLPDPPRPGLPRTAQGGGKGVSAYTALYSPFTAYDFNPENWALPKPLLAKAYVPDWNVLVRPRWATFPSFFPDLAQLTSTVTVLDWYADQTPTYRAKRLTRTADVDVLSPVAFPPTLQWSAEYPDITRRAKLDTAQLPFGARPEALGEFDETLLWSATYPDTTRRAALKTAHLPATFRPEALHELPATLLWGAEYPDTTRRLSLRIAAMPFQFRTELELAVAFAYPPSSYYPDTTTRAALDRAAMPSVFAGESIEHFARKLLATVTFPDTTRRRSLATGQMPSVFRPDPVLDTLLRWNVIAPVATSRRSLTTAELPAFVIGSSIDEGLGRLLWSVLYPDTTRRGDYTRVLMPSVFRGEALEQFQGLRWSVLYPDRTTRLSLAAADMPSAILGIDVHGLGLDIVDRRHDDQTDRAGSRSPTSRMSGF